MNPERMRELQLLRDGMASGEYVSDVSPYHAELLDELLSSYTRAVAWGKAWKRYAKAWRKQAGFLFEKESIGAQIRNFFLYKAALKRLARAVEALREVQDISLGTNNVTARLDRVLEIATENLNAIAPAHGGKDE